MKKIKIMILIFIITLSIIIFDRKILEKEIIDTSKVGETILEENIEANLEKVDEIKSENKHVEDLNSEEIMFQTKTDEKEEIQDTSSNFDIEKKNNSEKEKNKENNKAKISTNQKKSNKSQNKTNSNSSTSTSLSEKKEVTVNGSDDKHYISEGQWYTVSDWFSIEE